MSSDLRRSRRNRLGAGCTVRPPLYAFGKLMDFRRSGSVEAVAGEVDPTALAGKMANTIDQNKELQATYLPNNATLVRIADAARARGRSKLRAENKGRPKS
jgi:hypothetical protein